MKKMDLQNDPSGMGLRAMIVEDRPDVALGYELLLRRLDHTVQTVYTAAEALLVGASFDPGVIFVDIGLPDGSGYELCKEFRLKDWGRTAYIVAVTGRDEPEDLLRAATTGFDRHVAKPMKLATLKEILAHVQRSVEVAQANMAAAAVDRDRAY